MKERSIHNVPTPEQIRDMTAEIRKGWTPRDYRKRAGLARSFLDIQVWVEPTSRVSRFTQHNI
jgi:hypothetical protein